jgi:hypothetical protein
MAANPQDVINTQKGGAGGSRSSGGQNTKVMQRSAYESLSPAEQASFIAAGGSLT